MINVLSLTLGSILGGLSRYYLGSFVQKFSNSSFPYGTLAVNLTGCLLAGFIGGLAVERLSIAGPARIFLITGFCGAFTTFSAFMLESDALLRVGHFWPAFFNILVSVAAGLFFFRLGFILGK